MLKLWIMVVYFTICCLTPVSGNTITICQKCAVTSIAEGLAQSSEGDTLLVKKGWYREGELRITKSVVLIGDQFPIIDGQSKHRGFLVEADNVFIGGFQIQNTGSHPTEDWAAIEVINSSGFQLDNNRIINAFFGIYLRRANSGVVSGNSINGSALNEINSGNALHLWHCNQIILRNNMASGHRDGLYFEFVTNSEIRQNVSRSNLRYGLHFMFSNNNQYFQNTFLNNGSGVAVMFSKNISMTENRFIENWGGASYGLLLKDITDSNILNNEFNKNTIGIYAEGANRLNIENNDFSNNGWAFKMLGSCRDNTITGNNFLGNTFEVTTNSSRHFNHYSQNYWSQYRGYDLDRDGYGDVAHRPVSIFSFLVSQFNTTIILLRSPLANLINFVETILPGLTPAGLIDEEPLMNPKDRDIIS